jgi:hypothetical protein
MKIVIRGIFFSLLCIIIFSLIYNFLGDKHFNHYLKYDNKYLDYLFLATTIQSGVGYSYIYPITEISKIILIIQHFIMITTYMFLLYVFTL